MTITVILDITEQAGTTDIAHIMTVIDTIIATTITQDIIIITTINQ